MNYTVNCNCGKTLTVRAGDAGATKACLCGETIQIPALSVLRASAIDETPPQEGESDQGMVAAMMFFAATIVVALILSLLSQAMLMPLGVVIVFVGRLWFALLIFREMSPVNAVMVLVVPLMPTIFFFKRIDITWMPFAYGIMGFFVMIAGLDGLQR